MKHVFVCREGWGVVDGGAEGGGGAVGEDVWLECEVGFGGFGGGLGGSGEGSEERGHVGEGG